MQGSRAIREGTVGLFALLGLIIFAGVTIWLKGARFGEKSYQILVEFSNVSGLQLGAPVNYRGVQIGKLVGLQPSPTHVVAVLEISSDQTQIPKDALIQISRYGLIGEASIDVIPQRGIPTEAQNMNPLKSNCDPNFILCDQARVIGDSGDQLISSLVRLSNAYSDPKFLKNLNKAAENAAIAAQKISQLSEDVSGLSKTANRDITRITQEFSRTTATLSRTANDASVLMGNINTVVVENRSTLNATLRETNQAMRNANLLISENRSRIAETVDKINAMSDQLTEVALGFEQTINDIGATFKTVGSQEIVNDLKVVLANSVEISNNLREVSKTLNDPTVIVTLQKTLDSARVTFENTQKITSDLDELTGDPQFREQLKRLVNGLSNLVSSAEQLQEQIQTAQKLELEAEKLKEQNPPAVTPVDIPSPSENSNPEISQAPQPSISPQVHENIPSLQSPYPLNRNNKN